ncbi:uncharacterized protein J3D65DRAFT_177600 [Phyllosticta citribraziliensis]|uniref:Uncharacterized protein n=1 Tax=Phyllosticta citribraziliensis TaxID=989973 RepID=A0ABR1L4C6_9PEZI
MLRKSRAFPLAAYCWLFAASLQAMDLVFQKHDGIPVDDDHRYSIWAATYLPTAGVVILSFLWKPITNDLKKVTPWASMGGKWTKASQSILLDYNTKMEVLSVFHAARHRHFALFMALLVGFLCGALSVLANALTSVEPPAFRQESADFLINSTFSFNGTLVDSKGDIPYPANHLPTAPYASVAFYRLPGGHSAPWTLDSHAFESFTLLKNESGVDAIMTAEVESFATQFDCGLFNYSKENDDDDYLLIASSSDGMQSNCTQTLDSWYQLGPSSDGSLTNTTRAWLSVSQCKANTSLLTATLANVYYDTENPSSGAHIFRVEPFVGLACTVDFQRQNVMIRVNGSNGNVERVALLETLPGIDPILTTTQIWLYLNQVSFPGVPNSPAGTYGSAEDVEEVQYFAEQLSRGSVMDTFFGLLTGGDSAVLKSYIDDLKQFRLDVETLAAETITQVVSSRARERTSKQTLGTIQTMGQRLSLHRGLLRVLQLALVLIGCVVVLVATILRPRCLLFEDPGRLAGGALILSKSMPRVHDIYAHEEISSTETMERNLELLDWKLDSTDEETIVLRCRKSVTEIEYWRNSEHSGWQPLALCLEAEAVCSLLIAVIVGILSALLISSNRHNGLVKDGRFLQKAFKSASSAILVIIGYVCSGIGAAVDELALYRSLLEKSTKDPTSINVIQAPLANILKDWTGFSQIASSTAIFLMPMIKIFAAGLYGVKPETMSQRAKPLVDTSLVTHFEFVDDFLQTQMNSIVDTHARQFVEWTLTPSFNVQTRPGALGNLVFSNLTYMGPRKTADIITEEVTITVPAISIDVSISTADDSWSLVDLDDDTGCLLISDSTYYDEDVDSWNFDCYRGITFRTGPWGNCTERQYKYDGKFTNMDYGFCTYLTDMSNILSAATNTTPIKDEDHLSSQSLNVSLPSAMKINGAVELTRVLVEVTYSRGIDDAWTPKAFDSSTIRADEQFFGSKGLSLKHNGSIPNFGEDELTQTNSLWPDQWSGNTDTFFQWVALYAEYNLGNLTAILDHDKWIQAIKTLIVAYNVELLTEYRHFALENATAQGIKPQTFDGTLRFYEARIYQDEPTTIALVVLLGIMLCCYIWTFFRYPNRAILPKSPGSIAAQLSLVAHSDLVRRLREDGVTHLTDEEVRRNAALGWWRRVEPKEADRVDSENVEGDAAQKLPPLRWGIDVGEPVVHRSWNDPPDMEELQDNARPRSDVGSRLAGPQSDEIELQSLQSRRESGGQEEETLLERRSALGHQGSGGDAGLEDPPHSQNAPLGIERLSTEPWDLVDEDSDAEYRRWSEEQRPVDSASELLLRRGTV